MNYISESEKIGYNLLEVGHEFQPICYKLEKSMIDLFLKAVEETSSLYQTTELVPPMAVAAYAMAALADGISLPPGTLHVSQELEFLETVNSGETINCHAKVIKKQERGGFRLMVVGLDVFQLDGKKVLAGKTSFILPI